MSRESIQNIKPFLSVLIIICSLFTVVFLQMEERRIGYQVLKLTRDFKKTSELKRTKEIALAKVTRPQLLESMAHSKFTLKKVQANQIVHLAGPALPQDRVTQNIPAQNREL